MIKCKHCGHDITRIQGKWYHMKLDIDEEDSDDITAELSIQCGLEYEGKDVDDFTDTVMQDVQKQATERFGELAGLWYWFSELHCRCDNPEPEKEIANSEPASSSYGECKNCGHKVILIEKKWLHYLDRQEDKDSKDMYAMTGCMYNYETEKDKKYVNNLVDTIQKTIHKDYGENTEMKIAFEIMGCNCKKPEPKR